MSVTKILAERNITTVADNQEDDIQQRPGNRWLGRKSLNTLNNTCKLFPTEDVVSAEVQEWLQLTPTSRNVFMRLCPDGTKLSVLMASKEKKSNIIVLVIYAKCFYLNPDKHIEWENVPSFSYRSPNSSWRSQLLIIEFM